MITWHVVVTPRLLGITMHMQGGPSTISLYNALSICTFRIKLLSKSLLLVGSFIQTLVSQNVAFPQFDPLEYTLFV
jgi:hypothetical protein